MAGLRETKKARTRERIADEATRLFRARGFEAVTVAEVADAAEVSKMTVFNHFPRKEDMLFDRIPDARVLVTDAIRDRAPGVPPIEALRALALDLVETRHPLSGVREGTAPFLRVVQDSPALVARLREIGDEFEDLVAELFAEAAVARPRLVAAMTVAAYRACAGAAMLRMRAGEPGEQIVADHLADLGAAFDALARATEG